MTERIQRFLLANTKGLQHLINDRLASRPGGIGRIFNFFAIGERRMGAHTFGNSLKMANYMYMWTYYLLAMTRPVFSRFINTASNGGPVNYSGLIAFTMGTMCVMGRVQFQRAREQIYFNAQDQPEFWYTRYDMMFPPNFLHNRISAHYIEINHIFAVEMMKKYQHVRRAVLAERDTHSDEVKRTKYATNANYIYEPFGSKDSDKIQRMKDAGTF